jgi:hypothetical protein
VARFTNSNISLVAANVLPNMAMPAAYIAAVPGNFIELY